MSNNSIVKNSLYSIFYKMANAFFPFLTVAYVSHIILANGIGKVVSANNIAQYFVLFASLGIPNYGIREIAKNSFENSKRSKIFSELFALNLISTTIAIAIYYIMIFSVNRFLVDIKLFSIVGLSIVLNYANIDWFFQGCEDYGYIAKRNLIVKCISFVMIVALVKNIEDYYIYALISVFGTAGNYILNLLFIKKKDIKISFRNVNLKKHIKPVGILLGTTISVELYTLLDTTMITFMCDSENVAFYNNSMKLVKMVIILITAICTVLLPRLSRYVEEGKINECSELINKVLEILIFLFLPCGVGIFAVADCLMPLAYGDSFTPAVLTLKIASFLIYALGFSNLFGTQILLPFGCEHKLLICTVIGAISNILFNSIFIPLYAENGAAIASVMSETIVTIITFLFSKKYINYKIRIKTIYVTFLSTLIMFLYIYLIDRLNIMSLFKLIIEIIGGALIYILFSLILKNPIIINIKSLVKL